MKALANDVDLKTVQAIGLSGQMHGATLLDSNNEVIRPAILWNDGRSEVQCRSIEEQLPDAIRISGNLVMPGFTAPKILWVKENEPEAYQRIAKVLLPKDYLRFKLTGTYYSDMSDAAGTSWLDVANRTWSPKLLAVTGLTDTHMPQLAEGNDSTR